MGLRLSIGLPGIADIGCKDTMRHIERAVEDSGLDNIGTPGESVSFEVEIFETAARLHIMSKDGEVSWIDLEFGTMGSLHQKEIDSLEGKLIELVEDRLGQCHWKKIREDGKAICWDLPSEIIRINSFANSHICLSIGT